MLPLALPGVVAGSIFTFSLTLGDYITPIARRRDGSTSSATSSTATCSAWPNNMPFAAAYATSRWSSWPSTWSLARRLGAFEAL